MGHSRTYRGIALVAVTMLAVVPAIFAEEKPSAFRVELDLSRDAKFTTLTAAVPAAARKIFKRYEQLAANANPLRVGRGFAPSLKDKGEDKAVEWVASVNEKRNSLVLQTANFSKEDRTIELTLAQSDRQMLSPVYRRVLLDGKTGEWTRMAWEAPRNPSVRPWTVDLPANTVQTVLIRLKEPKK